MEGVPIIKFGDHIATEVSVQECHEKVKPKSIRNSPISISSHRKGSNSREQMELLKTINILVNDSESYCANSKSPQSPNAVRHDILIHKESKVEQPW
uniref:Putative ovule protein n=1 Tax=Solanum chacoense TaxID=4108 RepID=A0A0V0HIN1_SOLCH